MKCEGIYAHSSEHSVRKMCRTLELCEKSYYQWRRGEGRRQSRQEKERSLVKEVRKVFEDTNKVYGVRRLHKALKAKEIDSELVCKALGNALSKRGKSREPLIFHSDRGCKYSSRKYQKMLTRNGIEGSMSKAGCPYDNSCMERFFASLKKEYFYRREYATIDDVRRDLFYYIEIFYNRKRLHSNVGYMSPVAYRLKEMGPIVA